MFPAKTFLLPNSDAYFTGYSDCLAALTVQGVLYRFVSIEYLTVQILLSM